MSKSTTPEQFVSIITNDFYWRLTELSDLKFAVSAAHISKKPAYLRSLVVMCYAHWEGHAKFCSDLFVEYLTRRKLRFSEITPRYFYVRFIRELATANSLSYMDRASLVHKINNSQNDRFSHFPRELINTRSNLNSAALADLCFVCDIEFTEFDDDIDFIDRILLKRRNEVAHGEASFINVIDQDALVDRTLAIMRKFRDQLDNKVVLQSYRVEVA